MQRPRIWKSLLRPKRAVENFDLEIRKVSDRQYEALVRDGKGLIARSTFATPFSEAEIQASRSGAVGQTRDLKQPSPTVRITAEELGRRLFGKVFAVEVLLAWHKRLDGLARPVEELRLRLMLDPPELWDWPWEFLHDGNPARGFLAIEPKTPVVRYIEAGVPVRPLRVRPPLRILAVASSPSGVAPLSVKEELEELDRSLEPLRRARWVEVERLEGATRGALQRRLKEGSFHILHFVGHSTFDRGQGGMLLLERENGSPDPIGSQDLGLLLKVQPRLRLIVLNACEGARGDRSDDFAGLAQRLVKSGFPAVIGMRSPISDRAAVIFAHEFYEDLARREPVDRAISGARNAMSVQNPSMEWGSPVLAMRSPDGVLFDPTRLEILIARLREFIVNWRRPLLVLLLVALSFASFRSARRWIDPNFLWEPFNPPECPSPPGLRIAFVLAQSGEFTVGDVEGDTRPRRTVKISHPYCIARFETTQKLWKKVLKEKRARRKGAGLPVVSVSVPEALRFLNLLNRRDLKAHFRLPSSDEWEYAARAGGKAYSEAPPDSANCEDKERNDGFEGTAPVGMFERNEWGLYDVFGNAAEWVMDETKYTYVRRGGSYENALDNCNSIFASRTVAEQSADTGFRLIREPVNSDSKVP